MLNKLKTTIKLLLTDIAEIYPYLFLFYVISYTVSYFFPSIGLFFYWPAFHISIIVLGAFSLMSPKVVKLFSSARNKTLVKGKKIKGFFSIVVMAIFLVISPFVVKNKLLRVSNVIKAILITMIMAYAYSKNVNIYDFATILFALISVLFVIDSRISAGIAILLLITCPILMILKKDILAENVAVYAFYFLVITVLTQIIGEFLDIRHQDKS
ncbi:MAG: hypothetical protein PHU42_03535 [Patescibacteria group bacterium]|nr:hypothetical protein [Patescibacteria group bacterium]